MKSILDPSCCTLFLVSFLVNAAPLQAQSETSQPTPAIRDQLAQYCFDCHSNGSSEGGFEFDKLLEGKYGNESQAKWEAVWKNIRAQTMPPAEVEAPTAESRKQWIDWIQSDVFRLDPKRIDPGHSVLRRLNRSEYKESVNLLTGVDYNVREEFPADDTGYGFDTIGEALTLSPVLLEKYLAAASEIVEKFVPSNGPTAPEKIFWLNNWKLDSNSGPEARPAKFDKSVSYHLRREVDVASKYRIDIPWKLENAWTKTPQEGEVVLFLVMQDGKEVELDRSKLSFAVGPDGKLSAECELPRGTFEFKIQFTSINSDTKTTQEEIPNLEYRFAFQKSVLTGPLDGSVLEYSENARRVFVNGPPPAPKDGVARASKEYQSILRDHMRAVLRRFADKAFRRPVDEPTLDRLCGIGMKIAQEPGKNYELGTAAGLQLILASPRFLFRVEQARNPTDIADVVPIDDYSLATRLSYFLWGGPPDDELIKLAQEGKLHEQIEQQFDRMLTQTWRLDRGLENFVGQWLQTRDVHESQADVKRILRIWNDAEVEKVFGWKVRQAMTDETLQFYKYILTENRPALEILNAKYTFLNEALAQFYGIEGVSGNEMRKVDLPDSSHRRGILTHGSLLVVTSNPTRTSPVKRGLFLLENLLGTPAPPAPPNVPALEESKEGDLKNASLRQILEFHRRFEACAACHQRMDPLGLAMENFNAIGQWRDVEKGVPERKGRPAIPDQAIDPSGKLLTGESFSGASELADILASKRQDDFYRCLTEKLLTFAIGRGVTYRDTTTIDNIVQKTKDEGGSLRTLYKAIITSIPFTHRRNESASKPLASQP